MRKIALIIVLLVAAGGVLWIRAGSSDEPDDADRAAESDTGTVATERIAQLPPPPPQLPDLARPGEEQRILPEGWNANVRSAPPESATMRIPSPEEQAPVRAYRFVPGEQPPASPPPNPLVPAKQDLSEDDLRAGLPPE